MRVLMVGVDEKTKGGMWSVARGYLQSDIYRKAVDMRYVALATTGSSAYKALFFAKGLARVVTLMTTQKWDIVHIHMSERGSVYRKLTVAKLAKLFGCKVFLHLHGAEFEKWYNSLPTGQKEFVRRGLRNADTILILGEYWRPFISSLVEEKQKIKVLYNAVPVPETNRYQLSAKKLLFLGEVGERKGVYDLLEALKCIDKQLDDSCWVLLYGPNPDGDIVNRIGQQKLEHRVRYMGWADPAQFAQLFSEISVNILPSYHEGLPMTILETMAYGIPNITTDIAAIPEAVNQENGMLIVPGNINALADAIACLVKDPDNRKTKSENAYRTMRENFSTEHHMLKLIEFYEATRNRGK